MRAFVAFLAGLILVVPEFPERLATRKLALIIAISEYPAESGYSRINAVNDIPLVRGALLSQGFQESEIVVLRDAAASRDGILSAIADVATRAAPGDAIVFHYSGHGHRISDDNGDELDGYDEVLVPYDAAIPRSGSSQKPLRHLRDDDLGKALDEVRRKVGSTGSVTVFLDACYSGSATRAGPGEAAVRGVEEPIRLASSSGSNRTPDKAGGVDELGSRSGGDRAPLVVVSAARHDQVARETYDAERRPVGSLSLALSTALPRLTPGATYRMLHDRIAAAMAGMLLFDQRPQVEGAIDARVFSGDLVEQQPYHRLAGVFGDTAVRIQGGRLLGLLPGTRMEMHPPGTTDVQGSPPIARGTVSIADEVTSLVKLEKAARVPPGSWGFVTAYAFGDMQLRVRIDPRVPGAARATVDRAISGLAVAKTVTEAPDVVIRTAPGARGIELVDAGSLTRIGTTIDVRTVSEPSIRNALLRYARSTMLRRIELRDPRVAVRLELIRTVPRIRVADGDTTCAAEPAVPLAEQSRGAEGIVLAPGDEYTLRIVNDGSASAYVAILDITPDGAIRQMFPLADHTGSDNLIPARSEYTIPDICFFAEPPAGLEVIKLFATRQRIDFSPILTGSESRGDDDSPLAALFREVHDGTRSTPVAATGSGSTSTLSITVRPSRERK